MNATQLLEHFGRLTEAPSAVPRLRRFILDLAVRGKLVAQDVRDEPAGELLKRIQTERFRALNKPVKRDTVGRPTRSTAHHHPNRQPPLAGVGFGSRAGPGLNVSP